MPGGDPPETEGPLAVGPIRHAAGIRSGVGKPCESGTLFIEFSE